MPEGRNHRQIRCSSTSVVAEGRLFLVTSVASHTDCAKMRPVATDIAWSVSVWLLDTTMSCAKTDEPIEIPFRDTISRPVSWPAVLSDERTRSSASSNVARNSPAPPWAVQLVRTAPYSPSPRQVRAVAAAVSRRPSHARRRRASANTRRNASRNSRLKML